MKTLSSLGCRDVAAQNAALMDRRVSELSRDQIVHGSAHTHWIESFWAFLKRGFIGQYHPLSLRHLSRYLNESCYHFNNLYNTTGLFGKNLLCAVGVA